MNTYEPVIGLEVHAQLLTKTKIFCACPNSYGDPPNSNICPVCSGQPGALPVMNQHALELGIRLGVALEGTLCEESLFARKNYFYPDLPKGYQITQYDQPYFKNGKITCDLLDGSTKTIGVMRAHFEEDAGKSIHSPEGTLIDLNRAGVPLVEIVSEPQMHSAEEAGQYLRKLRLVLRYAGVCDGDMEKGHFRCDANVSIRPKGVATLGTRVELKNINSFKFVEHAIDYEIKRQIDLVESGKKVVQQTRTWNQEMHRSEVMREKEDAHDYRYFPEPDLQPIVISEKWMNQVKDSLSELPDAKKQRLMSQYGLSLDDSDVLLENLPLSEYFEEVVRLSQQPKLASNWVLNDLVGQLNAAGCELDKSPVSTCNLAKLIEKVHSGEISGKMAKIVFEEMFKLGKSPEEIIQEKGLVQLSSLDQLKPIVEKILGSHPDQVKSYREGKTKLFGFFVGQVMKETKGQANPEVVNRLLNELLR